MTADECAAAVAALLAPGAAATAAFADRAFDSALGRHDRRIVLFGAGNSGRRLLARLRDAGYDPVAFADNSPTAQGGTVNGLPVLSPVSAAERFGRSAAFVVAIWNPSHDFRATRTQLTWLGCDTVVPFPFAQWKFAAEFLPFFWADRPEALYPHEPAIRLATGLWADDFSRQEYAAQLRWRLTGDYDALSAPVAQASYFPDDLFALRPDEHFVDCGAFDGCTVKEFLARAGGRYERVTAFEPDPVNFEKLSEYAAGLPAADRSRVVVRQQAVSATAGTARFHADGTMGAALSASGGTEVVCTTLDELTRESPPTYVKMDIEGAEPDAIAGGAGTIRRYRPVLAICLYHAPGHLWELPLAVRAIVPDYRLYLRPHEPEGWQLVCYAVPPERVRRASR